MIKGFIVFGRVMEGALKIVFVLVVVEYFTGIFTTVFGSFGFDPIIADDEDMFRALETSGAIGMMLCGAFPMVYLIRKYLTKPLAKIGGAVGLSSDATAGLLAGSANVLVLLSMVKDLKARDKVICMAFVVCCAFLFGDHLSFTQTSSLAYRAGASGQVGGRHLRNRVCARACRKEGRRA